MSVEDLREYLGIVVDMEESIFLQNRLITDLKKRIKELQIPQIFADPVAPVLPQEPPRAKFVNLIGPPIAMLIGAWWCPLVLTFVIGFPLYLINPSPMIAPVAFVLSLIGFFFFGIKLSIDSEITKPREDYDRAMSTYNCEIELYKQTTQENIIKRHQDEIDRAEKITILQSELSHANTFLERSQERIQTIYSKNIIFPKYRNLAAVCSLYEYICAGRCTALEGRDGAYNIYEGEVRLDRIITQMDRVIANLGAIRENQFMLFSAIQDMNRQSALILESTQNMTGQLYRLNGQAVGLSDQIAELQKTSALTAYHAERTQKELAYMNRMNYLSGRNDDVFFNHPPV